MRRTPDQNLSKPARGAWDHHRLHRQGTGSAAVLLAGFCTGAVVGGWITDGLGVYAVGAVGAVGFWCIGFWLSRRRQASRDGLK
ncbi:hypothetical protein DD556_02020 [Phaeobacter sp. JL2872]|nr:hypothetical protein DD556_02020 [Phaeobacter sp. JL2872]